MAGDTTRTSTPEPGNVNVNFIGAVTSTVTPAAKELKNTRASDVVCSEITVKEKKLSHAPSAPNRINTYIHIKKKTTIS